MRPRQSVRTIALLAILSLLAAAAPLPAQDLKDIRNLRIISYDGEVHLSVPGYAQLVPLSSGQDMKTHELNSLAFITGQGWVVYALDTRLHVLQETNTKLTFEGAERAGRGMQLRILIEQGSCVFHTDPGRNNVILIRADGVEVSASGKAYFSVQADADSARVTVYEGKVKVTSPDGVHEVRKGYYLVYRLGAFTRIALSNPPSIKPGAVNVAYSYSSFDLYEYSPCGYGYGNGYYCYGLYGGVNECRYPTRFRHVHHPPHHPHHTAGNPPPPAVGTPGTPPRPRGLPRDGNDVLPRGAITQITAALPNLEAPRPRGGATFTTVAAQPKAVAGAATPDVFVATPAQRVVRTDSWAPRADTPLRDRVDVTRIPQERASSRGDQSARGGNSGGNRDRDNSGGWNGSSGSNGSGGSSGSSGSNGSSGSSGSNSSSSSSSSSGSSSSQSSAPAASAPAGPSEREPATRPGKPD